MKPEQERPLQKLVGKTMTIKRYANPACGEVLTCQQAAKSKAHVGMPMCERCERTHNE